MSDLDIADFSAALESAVQTSGVSEFIESKLDCVKSGDDLVRFFRRFALYNQAFPGGVASLAGALHVRSDLFNDPDETILDNSDRSSEIASHVIFAAEDEFATRNRSIRLTHRMMAQQIVREVISFCGWDIDRFNSEFENDDEYREKSAALKNGYRIYSLDDEHDLFSALGFHLGSERLADIEFNALNNMLSSRFPHFVSHTRATRGAHGIPLYAWIGMHTTVEVDHFEYSVKGAMKAVEYYSGSSFSKNEIKEILFRGFHEFIGFQREMFEWLD